MKYLFICSFLNIISSELTLVISLHSFFLTCFIYSFRGVLSSLDWSFFNRGNFILDHWFPLGRDEHGIAWMMFFFFIGDNLAINNSLLWLWVFSCISNNGGVSFDSSIIHRDFFFFFLLNFLSWFGFSLFGIFFSILLWVGFLGISFLSSWFLFWFLLFLLWSSWFLFSLGNRLVWGCIFLFNIFCNIFSQRFN